MLKSGNRPLSYGKALMIVCYHFFRNFPRQKCTYCRADCPPTSEMCNIDTQCLFVCLTGRPCGTRLCNIFHCSCFASKCNLILNTWNYKIYKNNFIEYCASNNWTTPVCVCLMRHTEKMAKIVTEYCVQYTVHGQRRGDAVRSLPPPPFLHELSNISKITLGLFFYSSHLARKEYY